jgi:hypothetical protein
MSMAMPRPMASCCTTAGLPSTSAYDTFMAGISFIACTIA